MPPPLLRSRPIAPLCDHADRGRVPPLRPAVARGLETRQGCKRPEACVAAVRFKCDVLWAQLDALEHACVEGNVPPGAFRPEIK